MGLTLPRFVNLNVEEYKRFSYLPVLFLITSAIQQDFIFSAVGLFWNIEHFRFWKDVLCQYSVQSTGKAHMDDVVGCSGK